MSIISERVEICAATYLFAEEITNFLMSFSYEKVRVFIFDKSSKIYATHAL